jgi:hypothetical protein
MKCTEFRLDLIEYARHGVAAPPLRSHLQTCIACSRFLDDQMALSAAMLVLASRVPAPDPALEVRVMAVFDRTRVPAWRWAAAACVALITCLTAFLTLHRVPEPAQVADEPPFLTIPYTVPMSREESATVWRTRIPVAELIAAGFQVQVPDPSALVEADVLVSQDGRARAVRALSISMTN